MTLRRAELVAIRVKSINILCIGSSGGGAIRSGDTSGSSSQKRSWFEFLPLSSLSLCQVGVTVRRNVRITITCSLVIPILLLVPRSCSGPREQRCPPPDM
ncbi:hypothetical protein FIBSPDRAFT_360436 [Athelia psychrophila]|uniref:Uncharacterized protein n=1 Tax=Athelia psychrophila TaxID=1759441 RepID=A0A167VP40_9AGAM|nr:hypothetical protein FIBSPDRAFT_360436 [Fibularhizoctonia sp. CBS 109695]